MAREKIDRFQRAGRRQPSSVYLEARLGHIRGERSDRSSTWMTFGACGYVGEMGVDPALIRMLRAGRDEGRDVELALDGLARIFGRPRTAERVGPHFTCREANLIAYVLVASRHLDAAIVWLDEHALSDAEDDLHGGAEFDAAHYITGGR